MPSRVPPRQFALSAPRGRRYNGGMNPTTCLLAGEAAAPSPLEARPRRLLFGPLELASRYLLSPLAGYTNYPFRLAVRALGCVGLATTDLVKARALCLAR